MSILLQNKTPERVIALERTGRGGKRPFYFITMTLDGRKVDLYRETDGQRAAGVYWYLLENITLAMREAREILAREDNGQAAGDGE